ncbi:MAG TPA: hypothetical protein VJU86_10010 [Pyrinomonadaceae bacterium]|nr:hypothetical protein [Pyrinomonadaceae bacterium]
MKSIMQNRRQLVIKIGAIIGALLLVAGTWKLAGIAPMILLCALGAGVLILLAVRQARNRKTEIIFGFYVKADEILGADGSTRYRFEISEAIKSGESILRMLPDPPPLSSFALGALYNAIGDHNGAIGHLALAAEEEMLKDSPHVSPSRHLRRYVRRLRQIERRPERWPKISAAIRNLERMQRERGAHLLAENQVQLKRLVAAFDSQVTDEAAQPQSRTPVTNFAGRSFKSITPPPPISEVLNDVYQEDRKSS